MLNVCAMSEKSLIRTVYRKQARTFFYDNNSWEPPHPTMNCPRYLVLFLIFLDLVNNKSVIEICFQAQTTKLLFGMGCSNTMEVPLCVLSYTILFIFYHCISI
jgi:hypothetical protein